MADFFKFRRELEEAKCGKNSKREEKLDPVGKADADIDNDGDVDSSDEYLKKRRKAISKAMKKEDDGPCWDGYKQVGTKMKDGKEVPNCVPEENSVDEARRKKTGSVIDDIESTIDSKMKDVEKDLSPRARKKIQSAQDDYLSALRDLEDFVNRKKNEETLAEGYYDYPDYGPIGASEMAQTQLHFIKYAADDITRCLKMGCPMPEWYQNKLAKMEGDMEGLYSYMKGKTRKMKAHQADRYSMGMSMYGEETQLNEDWMHDLVGVKMKDLYFVAKKGYRTNKKVYLQTLHDPTNFGTYWVRDPGDATYFIKKRDAEKAAKEHGGKVVTGIKENKSSNDDGYDEFFQAALKKFGVKGIGELDKEKKKEFFNYVDKNWKGDKEESSQLDEKVNMKDLKDTVKKYNDQNGRSAFHYPKKKMVSVDGRGMNYDDAMEKMKRILGESYINEVLKPSDDVSKWIEDFYDSDAPQFKGKSKQERREMAVAAWLDARREAGYDVGPNPNEE